MHYNAFMSRLTDHPDESTVLFLDVANSTRLYEQSGDREAFSVVTTCLEHASEVVQQSGGRVVKHIGDGLLAVFPEPDAAADSAIRIHNALRACSPAGNDPIGVRIGFHSGPLIISGEDVFGETVNIAARLAGLASPGRSLTTDAVMSRMSPHWRERLQPVPPRFLRGASKQITMFELQLDSGGETTNIDALPTPGADTPELRLTWGNSHVQINGWLPLARLGRDSSSDVCIDDLRASRQHATIELRGDKFVLRDHSSNGTYVSINGAPEFILAREEIVLHGSGWIALGRDHDENSHVITFLCS